MRGVFVAWAIAIGGIAAILPGFSKAQDVAGQDPTVLELCNVAFGHNQKPTRTEAICNAILSAESDYTTIEVSETDGIRALESLIGESRKSLYDEAQLIDTQGGPTLGLKTLPIAQICTNTPSKVRVVAASDFLAFIKGVVSASRTEPVQSIILQGFIVVGRLSLDGLTIPFRLSMEEVVFCGSVSIRNAILEESLGIHSSVILEPKLGQGMEGLINLAGSEFKKAVDIQNTQLGAVLAQNADFASRVSFSESIFGFLTLRNSRTQRVVLQNAVQSEAVEGRIHPLLEDANEDILRPWPVGLGGNYLDLSRVQVTDDVFADSLISQGNLTMHLASIGRARFRRSNLASFDGREMRVVGNLDFSAADLGNGTSEPKKCQVASLPYASTRIVSFRGATIGGSIMFPVSSTATPNSRTQALVEDPICLNDVTVSGNIDLSGLETSQIILSLSRVRGALILANFDQSSITWHQGNPGLDLSFADLRAVRLASRSVLPENTVTSGANIGGVQVLTKGDDGNYKVANDNIEVETLLEVLEDVNFNASGPELYTVFENMYRKSGSAELFNRVAFEKEQRITKSSSWWWLPFRGLKLILGGYGYRPIYALGVTLLFTVIGAVVFKRSNEGKTYLNSLHAPWQGRRGWRWFDAIIFSIDRLIPLVNISRRNSEIIFDGAPLVRAYFVFHTILGWLLASAVLLVFSEVLGLRFAR